MEQLSIHCLDCERGWSVTAPFSVHEQQALESCPCPFCGAYTVCCAEAEKEADEARAGRLR
jgi:hypothetical protein